MENGRHANPAQAAGSWGSPLLAPVGGITRSGLETGDIVRGTMPGRQSNLLHGHVVHADNDTLDVRRIIPDRSGSYSRTTYRMKPPHPSSFQFQQQFPPKSASDRLVRNGSPARAKLMLKPSAARSPTLFSDTQVAGEGKSP